MQLVTIEDPDGPAAAVLDDARGLVRCRDLGLAGDAMAVLAAVSPAELRGRVANAPSFTAADGVTFAAPYLRPRKIWGIGINYAEHAADLGTEAPRQEPASFMKGDHTVIGPGQPIPLPWQSQRVTAEAELGLVIGRYCRDVPLSTALDHVWGACLVLDQTAEDILLRNPRYLTRAKNFPGFFSFGPGIVPLDELPDLGTLLVSTVVNGEVRRKNTVANMLYPPDLLVSFHSEVMPLYPGDIISTGTPGAAHVLPGDVAECRIPGIGVLRNPVVAA